MMQKKVEQAVGHSQRVDEPATKPLATQPSAQQNTSIMSDLQVDNALPPRDERIRVQEMFARETENLHLEEMTQQNNEPARKIDVPAPSEPI
jgi:hypothetical protein